MFNGAQPRTSAAARFYQIFYGSQSIPGTNDLRETTKERKAKTIVPYIDSDEDASGLHDADGYGIPALTTKRRAQHARGLHVSNQGINAAESLERTKGSH